MSNMAHETATLGVFLLGIDYTPQATALMVKRRKGKGMNMRADLTGTNHCIDNLLSMPNLGS